MGRIADYVAKLSDAERERFKDLIEECSLREVSIQAHTSQATAAVARLAEQQRVLAVSIAELQKASRKLEESVSRLYLRSVPAPSKLH